MMLSAKASRHRRSFASGFWVAVKIDNSSLVKSYQYSWKTWSECLLYFLSPLEFR
jgi:hypothetical protein